MLHINTVIIYLFSGTFSLSCHRKVTKPLVLNHSIYLGQQTYSGAAKASCPLVKAGVETSDPDYKKKICYLNTEFSLACVLTNVFTDYITFEFTFTIIQSDYIYLIFYTVEQLKVTAF